MPILIRPEQSKDINSIRDVIYQAFLNHPHHPKGALPTEHLIVDSLRNQSQLALSLVAVSENTICGHIAFSKVTINREFNDWYGLGPVAVLPALQNQGIGCGLIRDGLARLVAQGSKGIVLLGDPAYYQRFGFKANSSLTLKGVPPEFFLSLAFAGDIPVGEVNYEDSFYQGVG